MADQYRVKGPCTIAGVAPGGTVTREQVEAFGGPDAIIHFDLLVGTHLELVADEPAEGTSSSGKSPAKKTAAKP